MLAPASNRFLTAEPIAAERHRSGLYKGLASYWSMRNGTATDVAWSYAEPFADASMARDHLCFLADGITTEVDGEVMASP